MIDVRKNTDLVKSVRTYIKGRKRVVKDLHCGRRQRVAAILPAFPD